MPPALRTIGLGGEGIMFTARRPGRPFVCPLTPLSRYIFTYWMRFEQTCQGQIIHRVSAWALLKRFSRSKIKGHHVYKNA